VKIIIIGQGNLYDHYGGGQVYVRNLIAGLLDSKHNVEYLSLVFSNIKVPQFNQQTTNGILTRQIVLPVSWKEIDTDKFDSAIGVLAQAFQDISPDIVHAHGWKELACRGAARAGVPCVVTAHHGGIVCPAGALLNHCDKICTAPVDQHACLPCCVRNIRGNKFWLPLLRLIPLDVQLNLGRWLRAQRFMYFITPLGTLALSVRDKIASVEALGKYATRMIAPSPAIGDALVRNGTPASKVVVVPHGIPLPQRQPLRQDIGKGPMRFLYLGRISYVKGVHVMLEAFSNLPHDAYELYIVGGAVTGPDKRYMAKLQRRYASINTIWHGAKSHDEIPQYIAACDVMVHPAICLDVFGLTITEALAVGRPVIATRCGGAEAQLRDGENGLLVAPNDPGALSNALMRLVENPELVQKMADNICAVNSLDSHIHDLEEIYKICKDRERTLFTVTKR
jgi:glycosyltransferase involved in cell wall biosynthesis